MAFLGYLAAIIIAGGCSQPPYAVSNNLRLTPQEQNTKLILDDQDQRKVESAFQSTAVGHKAVDPPAAAPNPPGMRWSDLVDAVGYACDEAEMAVVSTTSNDAKTRYEFKLRTIEDWPGQLTVERADENRVYTASATIGLFDNHPDRANQLLESLQKQMKAFGKRRKLESSN